MAVDSQRLPLRDFIVADNTSDIKPFFGRKQSKYLWGI